jgi:integrase
MKLTTQSIAKLAVPPGKSEAIFFDDELPGFGIRVRAGGSRTWIVQYQIGRQQRRASLGKVAGFAPDKARSAAGTLLAKVRLGQDPQAEKFKARAEAALTLGVVIERFLKRQAERLKPRTLLEVERHLNVYWRPLHRVQIGAIDRRAVAAHLMKLVDENGPTVADHARTSLSTLFTWAMKEGLVEANPVAATNRPQEPVARDRVLSDSELREIWNACRDDDYGRIVKLLLLTGQRREEISALRWSEVDLDKALVTLPKERTKNKRAHEVPLSDPALAALPSPRHGRDLVFGEGMGPFTGFSAAKRKLDGRIHAARLKHDAKAKPMAEWRLHDLRRTAATRLADLGVQPHVVEAVLNHVSGHKAGVAGIYNRAAYAPEKRAALTLWGEHVMELVDGADRKMISLEAERRKRGSTP